MFDTELQSKPAEQQVTPTVSSAGMSAVTNVAGFVGKASPLIGKAVTAYRDQSALDDLDTKLQQVDPEVKGLDQKFSSINQALESGQNRSRLQGAARRELKKAIADRPHIAQRANALYDSYFGGSGSGASSSGAFKLSPQEKGAQQAEQKISQLQFETGFSREKAQGILQAQANKTYSDAKLATLNNTSKVNAYQVQPLVDHSITGWSVNFNTQLQTALNNNGGTLPQESIINMNRDIEAQRVTMRQNVQNAITDPKTGRYTVTPEKAESLLKQVDDQADAQKLLLQNNSLQKFVSNAAQTASNEVMVQAIKLLPQVAVLKAAGGEQYATAILQAQVDNNPKLEAYLNKTNPQYSTILNTQPAAMTGFAITGGAKLFGNVKTPEADMSDTTPQYSPIPGTRKKLSPLEAMSYGSIMASNPSVAINTFDKGEDLGRITSQYPDALSSTYSPRTRNYRKTRAATFNEKVQDLQSGSLNYILKQYRDEFNKFPSGIQVKAEKLPDGPVYRIGGVLTKQPKISVSSTGGYLPQDIVNAVADLYRSIEDNPDAVPDKLKGLTPAQITEIMVNSGQDLRDLPTPESGVSQSELYGPYTSFAESSAGVTTGKDTISERAKNMDVQIPIPDEEPANPPTATPEVSDNIRKQVAELKKRGYELKQVLDKMDSMGLEGGGSNEVKAQIRAAWGVAVPSDNAE